MKSLKTLLLALVIVGLMAPVAAWAVDFTFGLVTYRAEESYWQIFRYGNQLEVDLNKMEGIVPGQVRLIVRDAATAAAQVSAIEGLLELGIDGLVITPAADEAGLIPTLRKVQGLGIPIVLTHRPSFYGPKTAFVGVEPFALGQTGSERASGPFLILGNGDSLQSAISAGALDADDTRVLAGEDSLYLGSMTLTADTAYEVAKQALVDNPNVTRIVLLDSSVLLGVRQAVDETNVGDEDIYITVYGIPQGAVWAYRWYDEEGNRHTEPGNFGQAMYTDTYHMFLMALAKVQRNVVFQEPLEDEYLEYGAQSRTGFASYDRYPYSRARF